MGLDPFIKAMDIERLLLDLEAYLFLRNHANRMVGLPTPVLMRILQ